MFIILTLLSTLAAYIRIEYDSYRLEGKTIAKIFPSLRTNKVSPTLPEHQNIVNSPRPSEEKWTLRITVPFILIIGLTILFLILTEKSWLAPVVTVYSIVFLSEFIIPLVVIDRNPNMKEYAKSYIKLNGHFI